MAGGFTRDKIILLAHSLAVLAGLFLHNAREPMLMLRFPFGVFALILLLVEYGIFAPLQRHLFRWRPDVGNVMGGGAARAT